MLSSVVRQPRTQANLPIEDYPSSYDALLIVDVEAKIKFSYWNGGLDDRAWLTHEDGTRLSDSISSRLLEIARTSGVAASVVIARAGSKTLRISRLEGQESLFALVLEGDRNDGKIPRAISRYQLTRRQSEVLALLLDGASASDVARTLVISEYTAQGYVKCLLTKTASRNRAEMVAKVLDWKAPATTVTATANVSPSIGRARAI